MFWAHLFAALFVLIAMIFYYLTMLDYRVSMRLSGFALSYGLGLISDVIFRLMLMVVIYNTTGYHWHHWSLAAGIVFSLVWFIILAAEKEPYTDSRRYGFAPAFTRWWLGLTTLTFVSVYWYKIQTLFA